MGHDIEIIDVDGRVVVQTYISGNFSCCTEYWTMYLLHGRTGKEGLPDLLNASNKLTSEGIEPVIPPGHDCYGTIDDKPSDLDKYVIWNVSPERVYYVSKNVLHVHIRRLIDLCNKYEDCQFWSDQEWNELIKRTRS